MVIYIGSILGIMYYLGITQWFCSKMGFLMSLTLKTTGIESVSLAANIFLSVVRIHFYQNCYEPIHYILCL